MFAAKYGFIRQPGGGAGGNARRTGSATTNASLTWTATGAVTSTTQYKFGTASEYVSTSSQYIYSANNPTFMNYGTGDFTIEWWMYIPTLSGHSQSCDLLSQDLSGGLGIRLAQGYNSNALSSANPKYIQIFARQQADLDYWTVPGNWQVNTWYFCALQRKSAVLSFWLNGNILTRTNGSNGTGASRSFASSSSSNVKIGTADGGNGVGPAYIDEICFSNTYRYTDTSATIPVPTAAFSVDTYTSQLLHMDGANNGTTFTNATS